MVIYKVTNLVNGKVYIGQTAMTIKQRFSCHLSSSNCICLSRAIKKHGKDNFSIEEIESCQTSAELNERESYWIESYRSRLPEFGYNIRGVGNRICAQSEETKMKLRKIAKEQRRKPPVNPNANPSNERREQLALLRGSTPFFCYKPDGSFLQQFYSSRQAADCIGVAATHIRKILRGKGQSLKGYHFSANIPVGFRLGHQTLLKESPCL